jgi:hypothetical protein
VPRLFERAIALTPITDEGIVREEFAAAFRNDSPGACMNRIAIVLCLTVAGSACGGSSAPGDYTLNLTGFIPHVGKTVLLKVKDPLGDGGSGATEGVQASITIASDATAQVKAIGVFKDGRLYNVDFFVDNNDNGACDNCGQATGEHAWRRQVNGKTAPGVFDNFAHDDGILFNINPY